MGCKDCQSYAQGGEACGTHGERPSDMAMRKRMMAKGGPVEPEDDFEMTDDFDFEPDSNTPDEKEDKSLVGQAMKRRQNFAKGGKVGGSANHTAACVQHIKDGSHPTEGCPGCAGGNDGQPR